MNKLALVAIVMLAVGGGVTAFSIYNSKSNVIIRNGRVLRLVKDFRYVEPGQNTCLALTPECGYCPGEVIDKNCYEEKQN